MPRPTSRVLALLELLQAGGTRTVGELAGRLAVDERTVRRYVEHLTELDVPVETIRGRYGGYRLARGYRLPPLMFTDDEVVAVGLGLVTARRLGLSPVAVESAAAKVQRVLPRPLAKRLVALAETVALAEPAEITVETELLLTLAAAAQARHQVVIEYVDRQQRGSERTIAPYGLVTHFGRWYVTAADSASGELRSFRLDRIGAATPLPTTFESPPDFDPVDAVLTGIAAAPWRFRVVVRVEGELADVRQALPRRLATCAPDSPGWVRVEFRAERLDWVPSVLLGLDRPFRVDEPPELIDRLQAVSTRVAAAVS